MSDSVRIVFLGGLGEIGRNCFCIEVDEPHPRRRLRDHVPRCRHARHRPRAARLHVPAGERRPGRGGAAHARARRPRGRARVPAPRHLRADLRLGAVARAGAQPHRGSGHARPHRADPGRRRRAPPHRPDRLPVHPGHALGAATASRSRSSRRRARSSTAATSSSTSRRSTGAAPTSRCSASIARRDGGVRLLLSDSTNAERPGFTPSESTVGAAMRSLFREYPDKRFIVTSFASHLHRVRAGRAGRDRARPQGRVRRPFDAAEHHDGARARLHRHPRLRPSSTSTRRPSYAPGEVCIICTGSQGEPMSALSLMAAHEHKHVKISPDDVVVISAHAIPGNESNVSRVIDSLHRAGAEVVHDRTSPVHVSGHASQEELKFLLNLLVAGVVRARARRVPASRAPRAARARRRRAPTITSSSARTATWSRSPPTAPYVERRAVPAGYMYVDGIVGDIGHGVLRDRRMLVRRRRGRRDRHRRRRDRRDRDRSRDRHARAGCTHPKPRTCSRTPKQAVRASIADAAARRRHRLRHDAPPRAPVARQVHRRANASPPAA